MLVLIGRLVDSWTFSFFTGGLGVEEELFLPQPSYPLWGVWVCMCECVCVWGGGGVDGWLDGVISVCVCVCVCICVCVCGWVVG